MFKLALMTGVDRLISCPSRDYLSEQVRSSLKENLSFNLYFSQALMQYPLTYSIADLP